MLDTVTINPLVFAPDDLLFVETSNEVSVEIENIGSKSADDTPDEVIVLIILEFLGPVDYARSHGVAALILRSHMAKHRLQLDFTGKALEDLDSLKETTELPNRAEVIRQALRLLQWTVQETQVKKGTLLLENDGRQREVSSRFGALVNWTQKRPQRTSQGVTYAVRAKIGHGVRRVKREVTVNSKRLHKRTVANSARRFYKCRFPYY